MAPTLRFTRRYAPARTFPPSRFRRRYLGSMRHASWWFLPWHRISVFLFEKVCRDIIEKADGPMDCRCFVSSELSPHFLIRNREKYFFESVTPNQISLFGESASRPASKNIF